MKVIIGIIIIIAIIFGTGSFLAVPKSMQNSIGKDVLTKCPSEAVAAVKISADKKITYLEYIKFKLACMSK
jgi:hypothetical protein